MHKNLKILKGGIFMNKYLKKISLSTILSIGLALSALLPNSTFAGQ